MVGGHCGVRSGGCAGCGGSLGGGGCDADGVGDACRFLGGVAAVGEQVGFHGPLGAVAGQFPVSGEVVAECVAEGVAECGVGGHVAVVHDLDAGVGGGRCCRGVGCGGGCGVLGGCGRGGGGCGGVGGGGGRGRGGGGGGGGGGG